jgi:hypothetical protein
MAKMFNIFIVAVLCVLLLVGILMFPVSEKVFAFEGDVGSVGGFLGCFSLVGVGRGSNFTFSYWDVNVSLSLFAESMSIESVFVDVNVTSYLFVLERVVVSYVSGSVTIGVGFSHLSFNVLVNQTSLLVGVEGFVSVPLWMAVLRGVV